MIEMPDSVADMFHEWCEHSEDKKNRSWEAGKFRIRLHNCMGPVSMGLYFKPLEIRFADFLVAKRNLRLWFEEKLLDAIEFSAWKKLLSRHHPFCDLVMDSENIAGWRFAHVRNRDSGETLYGEKGGGINLQYIDVPEYAPDTHWRERYSPRQLTFNDMRGCL